MWASAAVDAEAFAVHERLGDRLTTALRAGPEAIRAAAERELGDAGLLRITTRARLAGAPLRRPLP